MRTIKKPLKRPELPEIPDDLKKPPETVETTAVRWLCTVDYYEDKTEKPGIYNRVDPDHPNARSVGHDYDYIIERIKEIHPHNNPTRECLRWYASYIRVDCYEGMRLVQRRPRCRERSRRKRYGNAGSV